ncbi:MAG: hypothetical protein ACYC7H_12785, partial [Chloroflexota bacterium]
MTKKNRTAMRDSGSRSTKGKVRRGSRSASFYLRLSAFGAVVVVVAIVAFIMVQPFAGSISEKATKVTVDMSGFAPQTLTA